MKSPRSKRNILLPLIPLGVSAAILELAVRLEWVSSYLIPAPSQVFLSLIENHLRLSSAFLSTAATSSIGFFLSLALGLPLGLILASSRSLARVFYPYAAFLQTVPIVSIAPLLVIWFGYGTPTVIASAFTCSVFPIIANALTGFSSADRNLVDLFHLYGSKRLDLVLKLRIPFALPSLLTGARVAAGLAVIGAIVGEFVGGGGLGGLIDEARIQQKTEFVFAAVLLSAILGLAFFAGINILSHYLLRNWHPSEQTDLETAKPL